MSHWTTGLPKLDLPPFDPTPLYEAVAQGELEREGATRRRSLLKPALLAGGLAVVALVVVLALAFLG